MKMQLQHGLPIVSLTLTHNNQSIILRTSRRLNLPNKFCRQGFANDKRCLPAFTKTPSHISSCRILAPFRPIFPKGSLCIGPAAQSSPVPLFFSTSFSSVPHIPATGKSRRNDRHSRAALYCCLCIIEECRTNRSIPAVFLYTPRTASRQMNL